MSGRLAAAALAAATLAAPGIAARRVVVGAAPYPPFVMVDADGSLSGLEVDLVRTVASAEGLHLEFRIMGFQELLEAVASEDVDVAIGAIYRTPGRERRMLFTRPYVRTGLVVVERADRRSPPVPRIGVKRHATGEAVARRLLARGDASEVVAFPTTEASFDALLAGRVDWVLNDYINTVALLTERYPGRLAIRRGGLFGLPRLLTHDRIAMPVSPARPELAARLDRTLARLERSGVLDEMRQRWLHAPLPPDARTLARRGLPVVLSLVLVAALAALWYRSATRLRLARRYHELLEEAPLPVLTVRDGVVTWGNRRARQLLGWEPEAATPPRVASLVEPSGREVLERLLAGRHEGPPPVLRWSTRYGVRELQVSATAAGGEGELQLALADLTRERQVRRELEHATEELRELVRFQQAVLDAPGPLIARVTPSGRIVSWNRGAVELTGWERAAIQDLDRPWERLVPDRETRDRLLEALSTGRLPRGGSSGLEATLRCRDGSSRRVLLFVGAAELGSSEERIVLGVDVTEHLKLRRELEHVRRMEAVGRMAGGLAHTFNNLLQVVATEVDMAELKLGGDHPATANLDAIRTAVRRAADLTSGLLTVARVQAMRKRPVTVAAILGDLANALRPGLPQGVRLVLEVTGDPVIRADRRYLLDALLALGMRAAQAMPEGGHLRVRAAPAPGDMVRIEIVDTGRPPDEEELDRMFEPFATHDQLLDGSGLALASARAVIEEHGGTVHVERGESGGTVVAIELPGAFGGPREHG